MSRSARSGLTLLECIILLAIVGVLAGLMLPSVRRVRVADAQSHCQNNLRVVILGMHNYHEANERPGRSESAEQLLFPPGCIGPGTAPEDRLSWVVALLPYVEQDSAYRRFDITKGYAGNLPAMQLLKVVLCPASAEAANGSQPVTNFVAMAGTGSDAAARSAGDSGTGFMGYDRLTSTTMIKDGTGNTIALMETCSSLGPWARGGPSTLRGYDPNTMSLLNEPRPFGSGHAKGMNVAMADGSVRFVPYTIDPKKLAAAITIAGGESETLD